MTYHSTERIFSASSQARANATILPDTEEYWQPVQHQTAPLPRQDAISVLNQMCAYYTA